MKGRFNSGSRLSWRTACLSCALVPLEPPLVASFKILCRTRERMRPLHVSTFTITTSSSSTMPSAAEVNQTKAAFRIRRACPDEIDLCSQLVSRSFAGVNDSEVPTPLQVATRKWDRFLTRWIVYAGMVQRLVISSYYSGLEESGSEVKESIDARESTVQLLFVAESLHPYEDQIMPSEIIGVVELAYGECPIPFAQDGDSTGSSKRISPFVCNLAVLPEYRGLGVGKALLKRTIVAAKASEGSYMGSAREISEIWLQTDFNNTAALRMYRQHGFVCEGVDPDIRPKRQAYMRKRISSAAPEHGRDLLCIDDDKQSDDGEPKWSVSYDLDCRQGEHIVGELDFVEENFGTLAPLVAALGTLIGIILF